MTKTLRVVPALLLCLLLCVCLLPAAYADGLEDLVNAVERQDESFTVTEDMTIPEGVHLQAWDTAITVQKGKTLTIQGNINTSKLNINGTVTLENWGFLYASQISLGSAGRLNITGNNYMRTDYEQSKGLIGDGRINFGNTHNVLYMDVHTNSISAFNNAFNTLKTIQPEHFVGYLRVCNSMILDNGTVDMNSGKPVAMEIADGATLTVPTGTTLNAYEIYIEGSSGASTLKVNGKLYGNTEIRIREGGKLICANDSCFVSNGACIRLENSGNPDTQIQGLNLNRFSRFDQGNDILFIDSDGLFAQFKAACQSGAQYFDLSNKGRFQISESITIPAGMTVDATGTDFIVPVGNSVTVNGKLILTGWNLFGQANSIMIPEGGELHIAAWHGLAVHIWGAWVKDGSVARVTFAENAGVTLGAEVNNDQQLHDVFADFVEAIHNEHVNYEIRVAFPCTLSESVVIPGHIRMTMLKGLTVPKNVTLTNNGTITAVSDAVMTINGTLVNNNFVEMEKRTTTGAMLRVNGTYSGIGTIGIKDHGEVENYIDGIDLSNYDAVPDNVGTRFFYKSSAIFPALKAAIANGATYFNMRNRGEVEISESITIPAGMTVDATGTDFIVPVGNSVTVNGKLILTGWNLFGQANSIMIPEGGELHIAAWRGLFISIWGAWVRDGSVERVTFAENAGVTLWAEVNNDQQLHDVFADFVDARHDEHVNYEIRVAFPCTLSESAVIPGHIRMTMFEGFTVPENVTLTNNGTITALSDAVMTINGTLVNNSFVEMEKRTTTGAMLRVNGAYSGIGTIGIKDHGEVEGYISGIDLSNYEAVPDSIGTRFFYTGSLFPALKDAIANGDTEFNMRDRGTVIFTESITLPNTMSLHAKGTEIVIPDGVTLTVENYCRVGTLTVQPGGHVTVSDVDGAHLRVDDALNYNNVNQFTVNRYMEIGLSAWRRDLENLNFGERGGLTVSSWAYNDSELAAALAGKPELQNDKIRNRIGIRYDCTLADDLIVDDFNLAVEDSGSLTIPAGKTLVCLNKVEAQDGPIYLQGRMISVGYGQLSLQWKNSAVALLNISGEGFYAGKEIRVHAPKDRRDACISGLDMSKVGEIINPDFTAYFPPIEVVLPDELTALGGEAFANNSFHTVYIPSGITSIAPDAFSGTDVAIIYGVVGSYAEEYAADSGIPFLRLPDWYDVHDQQFVIDHTA